MTFYLEAVHAARADEFVSAGRSRILVVEDDASIAQLLTRELRALGHTVDSVQLASDAMSAARSTDYALIVVDLGLPDADGLDLVRELRRRSIEAVILMLTARRKVEDRVIGLASGADDYLSKPFAVSEVRARISALLRRPQRLKGARVAAGNLSIDGEALEASVNGVGLQLGRKQFQLLELFVRRRNHMTPRRMIEEALYGFDDDVSTNSIDAQVSKLRRVLKSAGADVTIETQRGIGYRLVAAASTN